MASIQELFVIKSRLYIRYVIKYIFNIRNFFSTGGELTKSKRCQLVSTLFGEELSESSLQGDQGDCDNYCKFRDGLHS